LDAATPLTIAARIGFLDLVSSQLLKKSWIGLQPLDCQADSTRKFAAQPMGAKDPAHSSPLVQFLIKQLLIHF